MTICSFPSFQGNLKYLADRKGLYLSYFAEWRQSLRDFLWQGVVGIFVYSKLKRNSLAKLDAKCEHLHVASHPVVLLFCFVVKEDVMGSWTILSTRTAETLLSQ